MKEKLVTWFKPLMRLKEPTEICRLCFKEYTPKTFRTIFNSEVKICPSCFKKFEPHFIYHKIEGIKALSIYYYDDEMKTLLYQFKGCFDIELSNLFFPYYIKYFHYRYHGYYLIPMPSYKEDDLRREFNHVVEMFKSLNLPILEILYKSEPYKQSEQKARDRHLISKYLKVSDLEMVRNKKILLVDDVVTTGSTLRAAINLIKEGHPKCIRILTLAMTKEH